MQANVAGRVGGIINKKVYKYVYLIIVIFLDLKDI